MEEKAWDYAEGNNGKPDFTQIGDILRCTVAVNKVQDMASALASLKDQGFNLGRDPKIRMSNPTPDGYHDIRVNATLSTGHVVEVQINTKAMLVAKGMAHKLYEESRSIAGQAVKENRPPTPAEKAEML